MYPLKNKKHIVVGMSGGVDSSLTAALLKEEGHHVTGIFMRNWHDTENNTDCPATQDLSDAQNVANQLNIPFQAVDFSKNYWDDVFQDFLSGLAQGETPNPDVLCNKHIKFRVFLKHAQKIGADALATGHYAHIQHSQEKGHTLWMGQDKQKDQSYFLALLDQTQLAYSMFPLGALDKQSVRKKAEALKLHTAHKKDSTGICFIGEKRFKPFMERYMLHKPGPILTEEGVCIGQHDGLYYHTIGQRKGLKIGGQAGHEEKPWYVAEKRLDDRALIVVQGHDHPKLLKKTVYLESIHWINPNDAVDAKKSVQAKLRYRQSPAEAILEKQNNGYLLTFATPQWAVTPGQLAAIYEQKKCLGGGSIKKQPEP
jgi:tRNA-uridine 2-sulfurtransferase